LTHDLNNVMFLFQQFYVLMCHFLLQRLSIIHFLYNKLNQESRFYFFIFLMHFKTFILIKHFQKENNINIILNNLVILNIM
jgi:hypothetical protein